MNSKFLNAPFNAGLLLFIAMSSASKAVASDGFTKSKIDRPLPECDKDMLKSEEGEWAYPGVRARPNGSYGGCIENKVNSNGLDKWAQTSIGVNNTDTYISSVSLMSNSKQVDGNSGKKLCAADAANDDDNMKFDQERDPHDYDNDRNYESEAIDDYYNHEAENPHDYDNDWGNDGK